MNFTDYSDRIPLLPRGRVFRPRKNSGKGLNFIQKIFANRVTCPRTTLSVSDNVQVWLIELGKFSTFFVLLVRILVYW